MIKIRTQKQLKVLLGTIIITITGFLISGNQEVLRLGIYIGIAEEIYIIYFIIKQKKEDKIK